MFHLILAEEAEAQAGPMPSNAVIDTYFKAGSTSGRLKNYCASCSLVLGALLPVFAPLLALCLINPWVKLLFEVSTVITPFSPCFEEGAGTVCPGPSSVVYYFWNVSNAQQVHI